MTFIVTRLTCKVNTYIQVFYIFSLSPVKIFSNFLFFQQGKPGNVKKQKKRRNDLPENYNYFCETCDRGFKEEDKYKIHINGHETVSTLTCLRKICEMYYVLNYTSRQTLSKTELFPVLHVLLQYMQGDCIIIFSISVWSRGMLIHSSSQTCPPSL